MELVVPNKGRECWIVFSMDINGQKGPSDKIAHMFINTIKKEFKLD